MCLSKTGSCSSRNLAKFIIAERIFLTRPASGLIKSRIEKSVIPTSVIKSTLRLIHSISDGARTIVYETSSAPLNLDKFPNSQHILANEKRYKVLDFSSACSDIGIEGLARVSHENVGKGLVHHLHSLRSRFLEILFGERHTKLLHT